MKLIIRDIYKKKGDMNILSGAGYTFYQGKIYGIEGNKEEKNTFLDCIAFETEYDDGYIELECGGKNCYSPVMISQVPENPVFPDFLTVREFIKYYIDINKRHMNEIKSIDIYLKMADLEDIPSGRTIKDFTTEEKKRLQLLSLIISAPPVVIINGIKNINNVEFLKQIKKFLDILKENSIVMIGTEDRGVSVFLCDEWLTFEDGHIQGGM